MNEEMIYFAEELEEMLRKGHKMLNRMKQRIGQRGGYRGGQNYVNRGEGQFNEEGDSMGERRWFGIGGYDPRIM